MSLVDAQTIAEHLGVAREYVYDHADELGAVRLGTGPKARLRFNLDVVIAMVSCSPSRGSREPEASTGAGIRPRRRRASGTRVDLLPIRGART